MDAERLPEEPVLFCVEEEPPGRDPFFFDEDDFEADDLPDDFPEVDLVVELALEAPEEAG